VTSLHGSLGGTVTRLLRSLGGTVTRLHGSLGGKVTRLREGHQRKCNSNFGTDKKLLLLEIVQVGSGDKAEEA
jgi:hypothetical protein